MTDLEVKSAVRQRDGHKCRDCGMTSEDHIEKNGRDLDVHRLLPGWDYSLYWCVTLCRSCHAKKAKSIEQSVDREDEVRWLAFNLYRPDVAALVDGIDRYAAATGVNWENAAATLIESALVPLAERDRADMLMQADGLW
jgi:hypothetical protein